MTNAIHADEKQSREGLLFGLDLGRAACPLDFCERGGAGSTGSEGSAGVVRRIKIWKRRGDFELGER